MQDCDLVMEQVPTTQRPDSQAMMETFRHLLHLMDTYGRLNVVSVPPRSSFHVRRIVANALDIPKSKVRVIKPRIGGGFGAKQTGVAVKFIRRLSPWKTGKPAKTDLHAAMRARSPPHPVTRWRCG